MFRFMVFNATFNTISAILLRSVLLVEEPEETTDLSQITDKLYHIMDSGGKHCSPHKRWFPDTMILKY
jgi:hypothetical protein